MGGPTGRLSVAAAMPWNRWCERLRPMSVVGAMHGRQSMSNMHVNAHLQRYGSACPSPSPTQTSIRSSQPLETIGFSVPQCNENPKGDEYNDSITFIAGDNTPE